MKSIFFGITLLFGVAFYSDAQNTVIDGYTDKLSYRAGETVTFYINAYCGFLGSCPIDLHLYNMNGSIVTSTGSIDVMTQMPINPNPWENGYGYIASTHKWIVPSNIPSGYYLIENIIPIIIKGDKNQEDIVVVIPTNTFAAYNTKGGKSLYISHIPNDPNRATAVSFLRPENGESGQRALSTGFLKWFLTANYNNMHVNFISDLDMDDYSEIQQARLLIVIGHSEYWTRTARMNFDGFVDNGINEVGHNRDALILSGNTMWWQVRYEYNNSQMVCYRYNGSDDPICEPLSKTINWPDPYLEYSTLSSIGSDWLRGGYGNHEGCYGGFDGHKIILDQSPLLFGTNLNNGDFLHFTTGEFDGSLMSNVDINGAIIAGTVPVLNTSALGFWKAELIGYDQTNHNHDQGTSGNLMELLGITNMSGMKYCPFMAFQKTCISGKIINVNSNYWCSESGIGGNSIGTVAGYDNQYPNGGDPNCFSNTIYSDHTNIRQITSNMIDRLLNGQNIWADPSPPASFKSSVASGTTVNYRVTENGSIHVTPCGVTLYESGCTTPCNFQINNGFKVDENNGTFAAKTIACSSLRIGASTNTPPSDTFKEKTNASINNSKTSIQISPNPSAGIFTLQLKEQIAGDVIIYNDLGQVVYQSAISNSQSAIDLSSQPKGIYFVKVQCESKVYTEKVILQ